MALNTSTPESATYKGILNASLDCTPQCTPSAPQPRELLMQPSSVIPHFTSSSGWVLFCANTQFAQSRKGSRWGNLAEGGLPGETLPPNVPVCLAMQGGAPAVSRTAEGAPHHRADAVPGHAPLPDWQSNTPPMSKATPRGLVLVSRNGAREKRGNYIQLYPIDADDFLTKVEVTACG